MAYITGNREQRVLLPSCIDEYIAPDDPVRAYDAVVEQMDLTALGIATEPDRVGAPAFDPRAMLKLLVYGYSYGIRSSRQLERATYHNLSFIWLLGGLTPDHKTIARFRRDHRAALAHVLKQCAQVCLRLGVIAGNTLFVDGTKIRANASMKQTWTAKRCQEMLQEVEDRIATILATCDATDAHEATHPSAIQMPPALAQQRQLRHQVQTILQELAHADTTALNTTDRDAGRMRMGGQVDMGYNCQSVVDDQHGLIVHTAVVNASNDVGQFSTPLREAQETLGKPCTTACADMGYCSPDDLQKSLVQGVDVIVPILRHSDFRDQFVYDATHDVYRCPEGHVLRYVGDHQRNKYRAYQADATQCQRCPQFGHCTTSPYGRRIARPFTEPIRERLEHRYRQPDAPVLMRRRKLRAEPPFGHIKHNLGMRMFVLRGQRGAAAEMALAATAFNIRRLVTLVGVAGLMQQLGHTSL